MQAAHGIRVSGWMNVDYSGCGECVDIGDDFGDAVDDALSDADGEERGIDHGNTLGALDPNFHVSKNVLYKCNYLL